MGRHASRAPDAVDPRAARRARVVTWLERVALGLAAAVVTVLVLRWAGVSWGTAALVGVAALVVIPVLAWVAATVPGHPHGDAGHPHGDHGGR